jgi:regulatory protein
MVMRFLRYHDAMSKTHAALQARLREAALAYLDRYESSVQSVRRTLRRRIERWAMKDGTPAEEGSIAAIEAVIEDLKRTGLIDDARYAGVKARSLFNSGRSGRAIGAYLAARGVEPAVIGDALESRTDDAENYQEPDLDAARRYARKKRLGPHRPPEQRAEKRDRDMAALGRAGFSWSIARSVVDEEM